MRIKRQYLYILIIVFLSFTVYFNTFFNPFIFDDQFFIVDNFEIRSLKNIPSYFSKPSVGNLYRPMRSVLYSLAFFIWRLNPIGYHLNAIILHTMISILVYLILSEVIPNKHFSFIASLLFVTHPIHAERVANMTGGFELLGILFLFLAFYNYLLFRKYNSRKWFVYSAIFFLLGLFSSEEVIVFPILALLHDFCFVDNFVEGKNIFNINNMKNRIKYFWVYIASLLFYLVVRFSVLQQIGRAEVYFLGNLQTRILSTLVIFLRYIYILILPLNLTVDYYIKTYNSFLSLSIILTIIIYLLILFIWIKSYRNNKIVFFSIGWFFIALLPFSNIFPVHTFMADRYLYASSFGFVLLFTYLLGKFISKYSKRVYILVTVFLVISYSSLTIIRNSEWKSDYVLLSKAIEREPKSSTAHNDLGQVYQEMGIYDRAFDEYKKSIMLNNKNHIAWLNFGSLYGELGNYSEAVYYINRSLSVFGSYKAYNNLGLIYDKLGEHEKAIKELKGAIEFNPSLTKAHMDLGIVYAKIGRFEIALEEFNKALEINPNIADIHYNLGILYEFLNQTDNAKKEFFIANQLEPSSKLFKDKHTQYKYS